MQLGIRAKDKITGFQGTVIGFCQYLSGCNQALLIPSAKDDGSLPDGHWIDVQRLEQIGDEVVVLENGDTPGFDKAPPRRL